MAKVTPVPRKLAEAAENTIDDVPLDPSCEQGTCGAKDAPFNPNVGAYAGGRRSATEVFASRERSPREKRAGRLDDLLVELSWRKNDLRTTESRIADIRESIATTEGEIALLRYQLATE